MMKTPCLVLDHDDTVVRTEETINYPCFCQYLREYHPGVTLSLEEYIQGCCTMGFVEMCRAQFGFSEKETAFEYRYWQDYIRGHIPAPYPGIPQLIRRFREAGGILCVVSHSNREIIERDYIAHFGLVPDAIYGWDLSPEQRKPNPWPLWDIVDRFGLSPHQLLVVDDMASGCEMARTAGAKAAFSAWGRQAFPDICAAMEKRCDLTFHTPEALERFLFEE